MPRRQSCGGDSVGQAAVPGTSKYQHVVVRHTGTRPTLSPPRPRPRAHCPLDYIEVRPTNRL